MKKLEYFLALSVLLFVGCVSYGIRYDTYLKDSDPKSLKFEDANFDFSFLPVPNGVYFTIINKTKVPATLQWDRCYFIEPDGSSSKAINVSLLGANIETIPQDAIFSRFTTSVLNTKEYVEFDATEINYLFSNVSVEYSRINKFYNFGRYWPEYKPKDSVYCSEIREEIKKRAYFDIIDTFKRCDTAHLDKGLLNVKNYILKNNNMSLGLFIKINDTVLDYRFDFRFKNVEISKMTKGSKKGPQIIKSASEENGWEWK